MDVIASWADIETDDTATECLQLLGRIWHPDKFDETVRNTLVDIFPNRSIQKPRRALSFTDWQRRSKQITIHVPSPA